MPILVTKLSNLRYSYRRYLSHSLWEIIGEKKRADKEKHQKLVYISFWAGSQDDGWGLYGRIGAAPTKTLKALFKSSTSKSRNHEVPSSMSHERHAHSHSQLTFSDPKLEFPTRPSHPKYWQSPQPLLSSAAPQHYRYNMSNHDTIIPSYTAKEKPYDICNRLPN